MNEKLPFCYTTRRKRRRITQLFKKQKGLCIYCKKPMWLPWDLNNLFDWTDPVWYSLDVQSHHNNDERFKSRATLEHKKPLVNGGSKKNIKNQACSCSECNGKKGNMPHQLFAIVHRSDRLYKLAKFVRRKYYRCRNSWFKPLHTKRRRKAYS